MKARWMVLGLLAGVACAQQPQQWSYAGNTGPVRWSKLDPAYKACNNGHQQSPVDIRGAKRVKGLQPVDFHYRSTVMTLTNDGRNVTVTVPAGSFVVVDGVRYDLLSFTFHRPGEHTVDGRLDDMDVQLLHKSADGKLLEIGIRVMENFDEPSIALASLWEHLPKTAGATDKTTDSVNPAGLLPTDRSYWTYTGSLTAPPCTEGVKWIEFRTPTTASRSQLQAYGRLFRVNSRATQELHGRKVVATQ